MTVHIVPSQNRIQLVDVDQKYYVEEMIKNNVSNQFLIFLDYFKKLYLSIRYFFINSYIFKCKIN